VPAGWVSAASGALGAVESIGSNKNAQATTNANNATAAQVASAQGSMLNQAEQVANQPFQAYTGTLTAPMSGNQQQANTMAANVANQGQAQQDNAAATGLISGVANNGWNAQTAQTYMNPYVQDVNNAATAAANKSYLQNLAQVQTGEAGSGAFGNSRTAIQEGELAGQNQMNVASLTATNNANAYNSAVQTWQADNNTKLQAANAYENAGNDVTNMNSQQISDLLKTGGVAQVISQTGLNNQYNQFLRQQGWSAQQLGSLISAVGTAKGGGGTQQTQAVQSNTANQLLGLGSTIAGLFGGSSYGSSTPSLSGSSSSASLPSNFTGINSNANYGAGQNLALPTYSYPTLSTSGT